MTSVVAQPFKNLVLEGAGIRGIAYCGAIKVLEEAKCLEGVERVGGTSAGAIAALAVALGYSSQEIEALIYDTKLQKFNDGRFFFVGGISRMNRTYGWYRGNAFAEWLEKMIAAKTGDGEITFAQLHARHFKDLYVTGTSLNRQRTLVFSHETYPDMKVKDAVRISMSIPLYFEAVFIDSSGRVLNPRKDERYTDIMVDGGLTDNFPLAIFRSSDDTTQHANSLTLGLRIDTPEQIESDLLGNGLAPIPVGNFKNYVSAFYTYTIENLNRNKLTPDDWQRTVSISSGTIGPKIRRLSEAEKNLLIANGAAAMERFLAGR